MLTDLIIKNFAIIESLHASFGPGFNVLSGETGAGKSIIIDAVNLLLGGRARGDVIRTGADDATVEAIFDVSNSPSTVSRLEGAGLASGEECIVRRILSRSGKNKIFINGSVVPLSQLKELTGDLVNIYGQNEHQHLQRSETHLALLDGFAALTSDLHAYQAAYREYRELQQRLERLDVHERERQQRLDMLRFQYQELTAAELTPGEDDELERERSLLIHAEKLTAATQGGYEQLYGGSSTAVEAVAAVADRLESLSGVDSRLDTLAERLRDHQYGLEDIATQLQRYSEQLEFEPQRQQQVEERLAVLAGLKRKYAPDLTDMLAYLSDISQEIESLANFDQHRDELSRQVGQKRNELNRLGDHLSKRRRQAADDLAVRVEAELSDLAMPKARFRVHFQILDEPSSDGLENVEFYLAANVGEDEQPLAKVASGGELSRIMLALKRCSPTGDGVGTLIFDEVDAGIGGEAATAVGEKIGRLGRNFQVLCVTHLPQVAAFSDHHFNVQKEERGGRTTTRLVLLDDQSRVSETARMLGGLHAGEQALTHARELIEKSKVQV